MLTDTSGKKYMLADEKDEPIVDAELNNMDQLIKSLGLISATTTL